MDPARAAYRFFSSDIAEILAPIPDVARKPKTGFLKFRLSTTRNFEGRVEIELVYRPGEFPRRTASLETDILSELARRRVDIGRPEIVFLPPRGLDTITKV